MTFSVGLTNLYISFQPSQKKDGDYAPGAQNRLRAIPSEILQKLKL